MWTTPSLEFHYRRSEMKIRITEVISTADTLLVSFRSSIGSGTASWLGVPPNIGDDQDVELDLDEIFSWGVNVMPSFDTTSQITHVNGTYQITAELIEVTDEDCAVLKLGDSILLIELDGPITHESGYVDVRATRVILHPTYI